MRTQALAAYLWPGLPQLWWRGDVRALMVAISFAVVLNFGFASTFVWPEMVSPGLRATIWFGVLAFWVIATWMGLREVSRWSRLSAEPQQQGLFTQAQTEYLKGHWLEAETLLRELLAVDDRDAEARLMLASLLRHADRVGEALVELDVLELSEAGHKWASEIVRERQLGAVVLGRHPTHQASKPEN
jgi:hypothetical protein